MPDLIFDRIEAALNALDSSTDKRIQTVDERLRALGVTVEAFLAEPADVWNDVRLQLGYARIGGRYGLVVRRVRGQESTVEPLRGADRATRIAVVDKLPDLLEAVEAEIRRRSGRLGAADPERTPVPIKTAPAQAQAQAPARPAAPAPAPAAQATAKPATTAPPEIPLPASSEVDTPLATAQKGNGGVHAAPAGPDSVDHMFRLFSRKGK